ncbi:MAG: Peptidase S1C [Planctomycetota bacterium]|nr:MAG: Peptidase S1C [Planctomycetota bacterium]
MRKLAAFLALVASSATLLVAEDPKPEKAPRTALFGAGTRAPDASEKAAFKLGDALAGRVNGQIVEAVAKDSPAATAGIAVGDAILALDSNRIYSSDDLLDFLRAAKPEQKVKVLVRRGESKKEESVEVTLGSEAAAKEAHIQWTFAGPAQMDAALALAKKEGKKVLVGLSGAET